MPNDRAIFIGYRRDDAADAAGRIYDRLREAFGQRAVFKDVDNLPPGADFRAHVLDLLPQCRAFLTVIGPRWLDIRDPSDARRIDDPHDLVRVEIETALAAPGLHVIPVLVNGARMPNPEDLPESLHPLTARNAAIVRRDPDFHNDMDRLVAALGGPDRAPSGAPFTDPPPSASAAAWAIIADSLDPADYEEFRRQHAGTPEALRAARHLRHLEAWAQVDKNEPDAIAACRSPTHFPALQAETRRALQKARALPRNAISLDAWLQSLASAKGELARDMARKALDWFGENGFKLRISDSQDSVVAEIAQPGGPSASPFLVRRSTGKLETSLQYLRETAAFKDEAARLALLERLKEIPGVDAGDKSTGWPTIPLAELAKGEVWLAFTEIAAGVKRAIEAADRGGDRRRRDPPELAPPDELEPRPTAADFRSALLTELIEAQRPGASSVEINSGELHRKVGGYPGPNHAMPTCCNVMRQGAHDRPSKVSACSPIRRPKPSISGVCERYPEAVRREYPLSRRRSEGCGSERLLATPADPLQDAGIVPKPPYE